MYVVSTFAHSIHLDLAISDLERRGTPPERLFAVPLDTRSAPPRLFDSIRQTDGISLFDLAAVLGTVTAVLGASFGFRLYWGPIIWGLIGLGCGAALGFAIDYAYHKSRGRRPQSTASEVVLIVRCQSAEEAEDVKKLLWDRLATGVAVAKAG